MSLRHQLTSPENGVSGLFICAWLVALTIFFVAVATVDLANHRPISGDDGWILSASYKLATQGIFGSDMYEGFFHADQHYFIALPGQHFLQALFLRLFGSGISQARWASVLSGIMLLWAVSILAWRWYGQKVAVVTSLLLLFWQPAIAGEGAVPLVSLSRSMRYDLPAVAWIWLTLLFFDSWLRRPTPVRALMTGITSAAATLTQFFGAVTLVIVPLGILARHKGRTPAKVDVAAWLFGFFSLVGPYLLYVASHWQDALGQTAYLKGARANFNLYALLSNLLREPLRYQPILEQIDIAPGPWLLLVGIWPALAYLGLRIRRKGLYGDTLLALALVTTFLVLALMDRTKARIYALPLLPALCIAFALLIEQSFRWSLRDRGRLREAAGIAVLAFFVLTILHGFHFYYRDRRQALSVSDYYELGESIDAAIPHGATVAGSERWWWPLRNHEYLSIRNVSLQWRIRDDQGGQIPSFTSLVAEYHIKYIIVDVIVRGDMERTPQLLQQQFLSFLERCTTVQEQWADATYGEINLYAVKPVCSGPMNG